MSWTVFTAHFLIARIGRTARMKKLLFVAVAAVCLVGCNESVDSCDGQADGVPFCLGKSIVTCQAGALSSESVLCENGCKDGECVKAVVDTTSETTPAE